MQSSALLAMFGLGPWEIAIVVTVALLVFGNRLPEVGRNLARTIGSFRRGLHDVQDDLERNSNDQIEPPSPPPPPPTPKKSSNSDNEAAGGEKVT